MKNKKYIIVISLLFIYTCFIQYKKEEILHENNSHIEQNQALIDSLQKSLMKTDYLSSLAMKNYEIGKVTIDNVELYSIKKSGQKVKASFKNNGREKFVIRYSNIGCNTCVNLIFKRQDRLKKIQENFDIVVLVDFDKHEDYVVWKHVAEIDENIFWLKKGDLPFDSLFGTSSYAFIMDNSFTVRSFFEPYNVFPDEVHNYLERVLKTKK